MNTNLTKTARARRKQRFFNIRISEAGDEIYRLTTEKLGKVQIETFHSGMIFDKTKRNSTK